MKKNVYLVGGGGHCRSCVDVIESTTEWQVKGIFDKQKIASENLFNYPYLGDDTQIDNYINSENYFLVTVGQIKSAEPRKRLYNLLKNKGANIATVVSAQSYISKYAILDEGVIVMHGALVNAGARIGVNCIINTKALIEHDVQVGNHCHISTASCVNGDVEIADDVFIGSNAVIREAISVPSQAIVAAGSFFCG